MAGEEPAVVEELRETAQHQPAVDSPGVLGATAQKTLNRLLERLENQLAGDYLRDDASVRGIYLLVWRGMQKRWQLPNKKWVNFAGLVETLQDHWASVTGAHPCVEEIKVIGIDLTKRAIAPTPAKKALPKKVLTKKASAKKAPVK